jgi:hypothetical protein
MQTAWPQPADLANGLQPVNWKPEVQNPKTERSPKSECRNGVSAVPEKRW